MKEFHVKSTGRICFFGDNADLIEKPAIAAAISACLTIDFKERKDNIIVLRALDLNYEEQFELDGSVSLDGPLKYIKVIIKLLSTHIDSGFEMTVKSEIPIGAGMSSSTALTIGAIRAIRKWKNLTMSSAEVAELSYLAESRDLGTECGRMDQYAISFGGITYITTDDNASAERIHHPPLTLIVADSQNSHNTADLQIWLRNRIRDKEEVLMSSLGRVVDIVEEGRKAFISEDITLLGELMVRQQKEERIMGTSTPKLDLMCSKALEAGALGAKQMGAGGGGCIIALSSQENFQAVKVVLEKLGCPVWEFKIVESNE